MQLLLSVAFPLHSPLDLQVLLLVCRPLPQTEEHGVHGDHLSHSGFGTGGDLGLFTCFESQVTSPPFLQTHLYPFFPREKMF